MNYSYPLPIQAATLPPALLGRRDIVGCAPTGSGKTLCYGVSCIARVLESMFSHSSSFSDDDEGLKCLVLTPTRELALQVQKELQNYVRVPEQGTLEEMALKAEPPTKKNKKKKKKKVSIPMTKQSSFSRFAAKSIACFADPPQKKKSPPLLPTNAIIRVASLVGGLASEKQARVLKNRPEIIVATPGRLWELVSCPCHRH